MDQTRLDPRSTVLAAAAMPELRGVGEYRFLRRLGVGGMGEVYLGYEETRQQHVAVKVLPEPLDNQDYIARFHREARSGATLNHPNIVRTLGAAQDQATGRHYLVMEFVEGTNALALLQLLGKLVVADVVRIGVDIARALEHAHSHNVIHRDIKPDNILITRSGVAKLLDFGLAKRTDEVSNLTIAQQGFGTTHYMPYEQALSARQADARSDIYALGATLYHLVTGAVPFPGEHHLDVIDKKGEGVFAPASSRNSKVPRVLDQIFGRMMACRPEDRYQSASELLVALEKSRLAAELPSFADAELARRDPWIQACLAGNVQPTRPDLRVTPSGSRAAPSDVWLVRFQDEDGKPLRGRATTNQILQRLRAGRLPRTAEVCRAAGEGFLPVTSFPEFADLPGRSASQETINGIPSTVVIPVPPPEELPASPQASPRAALGIRIWLWLAACLGIRPRA